MPAAGEGTAPGGAGEGAGGAGGGGGGGGVELREDVPLKGGAGSAGGGLCGGAGGGGARAVQGCFAALSAGIALALLAQVLGGAPEGGGAGHGAVAAGAAACSRAGAALLQAGGRALDAAAAAAVCLAARAPPPAGPALDASGALLLWRYRTEHARPPLLAQWGAAGEAPPTPSPAPTASPRPARAPRLLCALAALHAAHGALPWPHVLQPTVDLIAAESPLTPELILLGAYLRRIQNSTSAELAADPACGEEGAGGGVRVGVAVGARAGHWRVWHAGGAGGERAAAALAAALAPDAPASPELAALDPLDRAVYRAAERLDADAGDDVHAPADTAALQDATTSGLAVVDRRDTYVALVTGLSAAAAGAAGDAGIAGQGWRYDEPRAPLDLAPAIFAEDRVCGARFVVGAESAAALAQAGAALLAAGGAGAEGVERARLAGGGGGGGLAAERRAPPPPAPLLRLARLPPREPARAVNVVIQRGDALASHADSRAGGLASRF